MKTVTRIQTFDGQLHDTPKDAIKHLDVLYGNVVCPLAARAMASVDKYSKMIDFIDANLDEFLKLDQIKKDKVLVNDDSDD